MYYKRRFKKSAIVIAFFIVLIVILTICGIKLYKYYTSDEYKLGQAGYSEKEVSEILKFETFGVNDLSQIIGQLSETPFTPEAIEYIHTKYNRVRQIVQMINQMETFAKDNNLAEINMEVISQII